MRGCVASARASSSFCKPAAPRLSGVVRGSLGRPASSSACAACRSASWRVTLRRWPKNAASVTLASRLNFRNGRGIWNVRARPRWQTRSALMPPISAPSSRIEPAVGRRAPAMRLKIVLLPDPLGPIRPRISPLRSSKDTRLTAKNPSKLLLRDSTTSTCRPQCLIVVGHPSRFSSEEGGRANAKGFGSASSGVGRGRRQRQHRLGGADLARPHYVGALLPILHDDGRRALVLARHRRVGGE